MRDGETALTVNIVLHELLGRSQCSSPLAGQYTEPLLVNALAPGVWQPTERSRDVRLAAGPAAAAADAATPDADRGRWRGRRGDDGDASDPSWQPQLVPRGTHDVG